MTENDKKTIRKMQGILQSIENKQKVFFNITQYEKLGLTRSENKWVINAVGNKIKNGVTHYVTDKGRKYLNVII